MRIELESNDFDEKAICHFCGIMFTPQEVIARAYRDQGDYITDVCPECIAIGKEGISRRILERAYSLRSLAEELERLAKGEIEAPSFSRYTIVNQVTKALR